MKEFFGRLTSLREIKLCAITVVAVLSLFVGQVYAQEAEPTAAEAIFTAEFSFVTQLIGVLAYGLFTVIGSVFLFLVIKTIMGLRVPESEELEGLDIGEHGMEAYPDFQGVAEAGGSVFMSTESADESVRSAVFKESEGSA